MRKDELLKHIRQIEHELDSGNLSDDKRASLGERYTNMVALLAKMGEEDELPPEPGERRIEPAVLVQMNKIRGILGMPPRKEPVA